MSLLLEALRRAEEDSKKRKLMEAGEPALAAPELVAEPAVERREPAPAAASFADFTLEEQEKPAEPLDVTPPAPVTSAPVIDASALDFVLPPDEEPVRQTPVPVSPLLAPHKPSHPYGRYERPSEKPGWEDSASNWGALVSGPVRSRRPGSEEGANSSPSPMRAAPRKLAEAAEARPAASPPTHTASQARAPVRAEAPLSKPGATPRQALAAAGIMAGKKRAKSGSPGERRRQWILVLALVLIALPIGALLVFGEELLGSSSSLAVRTPPPVAPEVAPGPAAGPAAGEVTVVSVPASSAIGADTAALPSEPSATLPVPANVAPAPVAQPGARPLQPNARDTALATPRQRAPQTAANRSSVRTAPVAAATSGVSPGGGSSRPASQMEAAYAAYQSGNTVEAARLYREVLKVDATQRDAWLGLAVIAHADNQLEPAMDAYRRVLRLEPQNATALAGVSSLGRAASEPQQESRLRDLLTRSPQAPDLNQALGLYLSGEQRWSEAQPLFFKAHSLAPQEPQFAYNLAVALDQMRKTTLAAQYYEVALGLAQGRAAGFDEAAARNRLAVLRAAR